MDREIYFFLFDWFGDFASCERESTNAIQVKWIRRRFLENIAEEDDRFSLSFSPSDPRSLELWESRRSKATSFSRAKDRCRCLAFAFCRLEWRERKALSFFLDHLRFLIRMSQEQSYMRSFKEATVARGAASCSGNSERKYLSLPLLSALQRLSPEQAANAREHSNAFALGVISEKVSVVCRHVEASIRKVNRSCESPTRRKFTLTLKLRARALWRCYV